jgi:hypothetical protein
MRSFKNIRENYFRWLKSGGKKNNAKYFKNCVNEPLFNGDDDVLEVVPPPELHLMLGAVNHMWTGMEAEFPEICRNFARKLNIERESFHGGSFNGNSCKKILKKTDVLRELGSIECLKFVDAFKAFNDVVHSCFGNELHENYNTTIDNFKKAYLDLGLSVTTRVTHFCFVF